MRNPFTKSPGYIQGRYDPLNGWFLVQTTRVPASGLDESYPWAVTSLTRRETIYTETKSASLDIMARGADSVRLDKWDHEFHLAGIRAKRADQPYLSFPAPKVKR